MNVRFRYVFWNVLTAVISVVGALVIGEVAVRVFYPQETVATIKKRSFRCFSESAVMPFAYQPNCVGTTGIPPTVVRINSMGIRNKELEKTDKRRLLLLGDSFVFGSGVSEEERLGDLMEQRGNMQVISAGFWGGAGPDTSYVYLRYWGVSLRPDLVIVALFPFNDLEDLDATVWEEDEEGIRLITRNDTTIQDGYLAGTTWVDRVSGGLLDHSRVWSLVRRSQIGLEQLEDKMTRKVKRWLKKPAPTHGEVLRTCLYGLECYGPLQKAVEKFRRLVDMTETLAQQHQTTVVYVLIPASDQIFGSDPEWSIMRHVLNDSGVSYLDLFGALRQSGYTKDELYQPDGHWTALGHAVAAKAAATWLGQLE